VPISRQISTLNGKDREIIGFLMHIMSFEPSNVMIGNILPAGLSVAQMPSFDDQRPS
jgi:hypothetical protein